MNLIFLVIVILVAVYFLAIMPRMFGRPDRSMLFGYDYAHRGLHDNTGDAPENSMKAFRAAVDAGYGIELDIQLTKDRVPVIFHDEDLKRVCHAEGKVRDFTYEELRKFTLCNSKEQIPSLEEVLQIIDGRVPLIIEIKAYEKAKDVCTLADRFIAAYKGVYCIESFDPRVLVWYRSHRAEVVRGQLSCAFYENGKKSPVFWALQYLLTDCISRPDFIAYDHRHKQNISRRLVCGLFGALSVAWTIRSREELDQARDFYELFIFEGFLPQGSKRTIK